MVLSLLYPAEFLAEHHATSYPTLPSGENYINNTRILRYFQMFLLNTVTMTMKPGFIDPALNRGLTPLTFSQTIVGDAAHRKFIVGFSSAELIASNISDKLDGDYLPDANGDLKWNGLNYYVVTETALVPFIAYVTGCLIFPP